MIPGAEPGPTELESVLTVHARRYPLMGPCDGVKLIFQNEFGGGHLIADEGQALARLRAEYAQVPHDPARPLFEAIGNGTVRVMLSALDVRRCPLECLNRDFIRSAAARTGDLGRFSEKLGVLRDLCRRGVFRFSPEELEAYLDRYTAAGCPPVSHSDEYRRAYVPAYRVVLCGCLSSPLAEALAAEGLS